MDNVKNITKNIEKPTFYKALAMFSICIYIIISTIFDAMKTELSRLSSIAIYFCLVCCVIYIFSRGTFKIGKLEMWLIVFELTLIVSLLYTEAPSSVVNMYFHRSYTSAILVLLISNTVKTQRDFAIIIDTYIAAGALFSIYIYYTYGFLNLAGSTTRLDSLFGNQNGTGVSCAFPICFAVYRAVTGNRKKFLLYVLSALICVPAVMFTGSRKALLIVVMALISFALIYSKNKALIVKILWAAVIIFVLFAVIFYVPAFSVIKDRMLSTFAFFDDNPIGSTVTSDNTRMWYIKSGLREFFKSPIFGNGFFHSRAVFNSYSHCNYIELLMNGGIIGFVSFYWIHIAIWNKAKKLLKTTEDRNYGVFLVMLIVAFLVVDIGVVSYYDRYTLIMFTLCFCDEKLASNLPKIQK